MVSVGGTKILSPDSGWPHGYHLYMEASPQEPGNYTAWSFWQLTRSLMLGRIHPDQLLPTHWNHQKGCEGITQIHIQGLKTAEKQEGIERSWVSWEQPSVTWLIPDLPQLNRSAQGQAGILQVSECWDKWNISPDAFLDYSSSIA